MIDLGGHGVVWSLPALDDADLAACCEVLWEEGHRAWSLSSLRLERLTALRALFGRRALIGVEQVDTAGQASAAVAAGAAFLASRFGDGEVVTAAAGVPVILGGLTPQELHDADAAGAAAVQVVPCEAFGNLYARSLPELMAPVPVIAAGRLERYQAELWLGAGAIGVWPTGLVKRSLVEDTGLGALRELCQSWQF